MANNILLKKSSVAAKVPTTGDLDYGELALNYADGALYYKTSSNTIARLNPLEADTLATVTGRGATTSTAITVGGLTSNGAAEFKSSVGFFTATLNPTVELRYGSTWNNGRLQVLNGPTVMWEFGPSAVTSQVPITIAGGNFNVSSGSATVSGDITAGGLFRVTDGQAIRCTNTGPSGSFYLDSPVITWRNPSTSYSTLAQITPTGLSIAPTTASTTTSNGALVVSGGVGVAGAINAGGAVTTTGLTVNGASSLSGDVTNVDSISFDLTAAEATGIGKLYWDAGVGELRYGLGGGNVDLGIGQMQVTYCRNAETTTITKGQVVYLFGAQGDRPSVKLASNTSDTTSAKTFGIAAENIAANGDGYIVNVGTITGINTSMYSPGDILWLGSTAGTFTTTKAVAPNHLVFIGVVQKANQGGGQIYVRVQNGYELDEIHDVLISGVGLNHSLFYDTSVNVWKNYAPSAARTNLGLGTIATQNANSVAITGGAIDGTPIGATTPSTGKFTTLQTTGNVTVGGNLTVSGTTTTVNAQNLSISDNLIYLNEGSTNSNPDIGFAANYNDGTYRHTGFFRDATDGYWKVFKNYTPEPDASIYIDTSHASFALADIQAANFRGALVGNATTASTLAGTPTINGVTFNGGSNITITSNTTNTLTIGDGLSGTSFNGSAAVTIAADSTIARRADVTYVGTTSIALNRASAAQTLTGINGLTAVGTNQSITLTPTGTGGVGIGTSSPNELLSIGYIDGSYGRIEFRSASYARQAIIEGVDDASGGNGHLAIYTRNSGSVFERLRVASNGNIGVGTTNPTTKFHISGGSLLVDAFNVGDETGIFFRDGFASPGNYNCSILVKDHNGSSPDGISINGYDGVSICTGADTRNERMRVAQNGNVGIGTTSPSAKLSVVGTSDQTQFLIKNYSSQGNYTFQLQNSSGNAVLAFAASGSIVRPATVAGDLTLEQLGANSITFNTNGSEKVRITSSGDIGVGTTSPAQKLDVRGYVVSNANGLASEGGFYLGNNGHGIRRAAATNDVYVYTSSGSLYLGTSGTNTQHITVSSTGNVGLGVSPTTLLHLRGSSPVIAVDDSGNGTAALSFRSAGSSYAERAALSLNTTAAELRLSAGVASNTYFQTFHTNGSERMRITSDGNVGIATSSPSHKLDINGNVNISAGNPLRWGSGNAEIVDSSYNLLFKVYDGTSSVQERLRITSAGNVGIGTTTPARKLDVNGDASIGTNLIVGTAVYASQYIAGNSTQTYWKSSTSGILLTLLENGNFTAVGTGTFQGSNVTVDGSSYSRSVYSISGTGKTEIGYGPTGYGFGGRNTGSYISYKDYLYIGTGAANAPTITILESGVGGNVSIGTTATVGNTTLTANVGIAAYSNTAGVSPYLQTYNGNATLNEKTWRMGGQANGKFQIETVNDTYSAASTKVIISQTGNVGIGVDPTEKLHVAGAARITGILYDSAYNAGTNGQVLTSTGTGTAWSSTGVAVSGNGNTNYVAKWSSSTGLTDSGIYETADGKVSIGAGTSPTQKLEISGNFGWGSEHVLSYSALTTNSTTANQVITSVSTTVYRTFKFIIQATDATAGKYQSQEILAVHNGSTVAHTEYTAINVGGAVATYDVDISGSTVRLLCTPLSANSTVFKVSMQLIKV